MLLSFRFANHRSFRDEQQLVLTPVYGAEAMAAVPVVGVFGANASGKSNALKALVYLQNLVLRSDRDSEPGGGIQREPFRLDAESPEGPSSFVVDLLIEGGRYTYGLEIDGERVLAEWLYSYPSGRRRKIFERDGDRFSYGEQAKRTTIAQVEAVTARNVLFLSTTARFGQEIVQPVYAWFQDNPARERVLKEEERRADSISLNTARSILGDDQRRRDLSELIKAADTGIDELRRENLESGAIRLGFSHRGLQGDVLFNFGEESKGTLQMLEIADRSLTALAIGGLLLADEIDSSLHPLLTAEIVRLFQSPDTNPNSAQLIFTSHDTTLLGSLDGAEVLRRDQVWFVAKDRESGASSLFPLSDFKPRNEENRQRRYLNGSYGAIPETSSEYLVDRHRHQREVNGTAVLRGREAAAVGGVDEREDLLSGRHPARLGDAGREPQP